MHMRLSSLLTFLFSVAALVLTLLCLLAGSSKSFLQSADLLTLNVSRIGHGTVFDVGSGNSGLSGLLNTLEGDFNKLLDGAEDEVDRALNLTDFYAVHVMNYCDGYFEPNAESHHAHKNTTYCSPTKSGFHFNATKVIDDALPDGIGLSEIHWPDEINDAEKAIRITSIVMFVFYIIGIAFAGLAIIGAVISFFSDGRLSACCSFLIDIMAFLFIGIASAVATAVITIATDKINKYGKEIGVSATKGTTFLGMTWGATAAMLLAAIVSIAQCCVGRRRHTRRDGEKPY